MRSIHCATALVLSLATLGASAQSVRVEKNMSLELASKIAAATVAACSADKYNVTATVVDRAGGVAWLIEGDDRTRLERLRTVGALEQRDVGARDAAPLPVADPAGEAEARGQLDPEDRRVGGHRDALDVGRHARA